MQIDDLKIPKHILLFQTKQFKKIKSNVTTKNNEFKYVHNLLKLIQKAKKTQTKSETIFFSW